MGVLGAKRRKTIIRMNSKPVKRKMSYSSVSSASSSVKPRRVVAKKAETPIAQSSLSVRHKTLKKNHKGKAKKVVRVPKKLRKQIVQTLESKQVPGHGRVLMLGTAKQIWGTNILSQAVFPLPLPRCDGSLDGKLFDPLFIMYAASRLWNGRLNVGADLTTGAWSNVNVQKSTGGEWANFTQLNASGATDVSSFKVNVTDLKAKLTLKNNSTRTMYLKMYVCKPKYQRQDLQTTNNLPINDWTQDLQADFNAQIDGIQTATTKASGINVANQAGTQSVFRETMYACPLQLPQWKKKWNANKYEIILEPGQTHNHWVQGDEIEYDFAKMYSKASDGTNQFQNIQKTDRHIFFTGVSELATQTTGSINGRIAGNANGVLLFETEIFCRMTMPESAGTSITNIGNLITNTSYMQPLTQRKRAYFVDIYHQSVSDNQVTLNANVDDNTTTFQTS